jgi:hypothetical protein
VANTKSYSGGITVNTRDFTIGTQNDTANIFRWDGLIDEVGFWKRVLTSAERTELYNSGNGRDYAYITAAAGVSLTPGVGAATLTGLAPRMDFGIIVPTAL